MLATHTSGLPRLPPNITPADMRDPYADYTPGKLLAALAKSAADVKAPADYAYSNFGAAVLGQALAAAWGQSYAEALRQHVLDPLGLNQTTLGLTGTAAPETWRQGTTRKARRFRTGPATPSPRPARCVLRRGRGSVSAGVSWSARDAAGGLVHRDHAAPTAAGGARRLDRACLAPDRRQSPIIWHNGGTGGYRSFIGFEPRGKCGIVVLVNIGKARTGSA